MLLTDRARETHWFARDRERAALRRSGVPASWADVGISRAPGT